jgi:hypothetical protein
MTPDPAAPASTPGHAAARVAGLVLAAAAATAGTWTLAAPHLGVALRLAAAPARVTDERLDVLVAAGCATALLLCWVWLTAGLVACLPGSLRRPGELPRGRAARWCPLAARLVVLVTLGCGLAGPATAGTGGGSPAPDLQGLALPDRPAAAPAVRIADAPERRVRVRPGDSLWSIAETLLPPGTPDAAVDRAWRVIAAANRPRIGPDPDLIFPGARLRVPDLVSNPGKDLP